MLRSTSTLEVRHVRPAEFVDSCPQDSGNSQPFHPRPEIPNTSRACAVRHRPLESGNFGPGCSVNVYPATCHRSVQSQSSLVRASNSVRTMIQRSYNNDLRLQPPPVGWRVATPFSCNGLGKEVGCACLPTKIFRADYIYSLNQRKTVSRPRASVTHALHEAALSRGSFFLRPPARLA
jgi:hypothetical protein